MKRLLVTGATGFVGAHVVRKAVRYGFDVVAGMRDENAAWRLDGVEDCAGRVKLDLLAPQQLIDEAILSIQPHVIIHCAAYGVNYSDQDLMLAIRTNIIGTVALLEASRKANVERVLALGTCFEYGDKAEAAKEDGPLNPVAMYGSTKAAASIIVQERARSIGVPLVWIRPFGLWGPLEGSHKLVPQVVRACLTKTPLELTGCQQVRDYLYVEDLAEALVVLAGGERFPAGETLNMGSGIPITLKDFVLSIAKQLDGESFMRFGALPYRPMEIWQLVADMTKWTSAGYPPIVVTPLEVGIERMANEYMGVEQ